MPTEFGYAQCIDTKLPTKKKTNFKILNASTYHVILWRLELVRLFSILQYVSLHSNVYNLLYCLLVNNCFKKIILYVLLLQLL